jgi:hypothetical protein
MTQTETTRIGRARHKPDARSFRDSGATNCATQPLDGKGHHMDEALSPHLVFPPNVLKPLIQEIVDEAIARMREAVRQRRAATWPSSLFLPCVMGTQAGAARHSSRVRRLRLLSTTGPRETSLA